MVAILINIYVDMEEEEVGATSLCNFSDAVEISMCKKAAYSNQSTMFSLLMMRAG